MITERQLARRSLNVGASEVPAILGIDPWRNAADVYAEKVYGVESVTNEAMEMGNVLEPVVAELAEKHIGKIRATGTERRIKDSPILAHVDRIVVATRDPVEIKTSGILHPYAADRDEWGEAGSDQVPERVIVQTHCHMAATDRPVCHVPTLLGGRGFVLFKVNFDEELWRHILSKVQAFWCEHIETKIPPPDCLPSMETIKRIKRLPGKTIEATPEMLNAWEVRTQAQDAVKQSDDAFNEWDRRFKCMLADAECVTMPDGSTVTYMLQQRKGFTVEPSEFRVLRHKKKGKGTNGN